EGRRHVVGNLAARIPQDEGPESVGLDLAAIALRRNHVAGVDEHLAGHGSLAQVSEAKLEPARPSTATPRTSATVIPRSAKDLLVPRSRGAFRPIPDTSTGVCSRV